MRDATVVTMCRAGAAAGFVLMLGLGLTSCESGGDPVAPADSILTVSADPQTLVIRQAGDTATSEITATLRSKNGARLPDQEVTFSTSAGMLDPVAETPILTDEDGQARSTLSTSQAATVTARSGSITGNTQVQTTPCPIAEVLLNVENLDAASGGAQLETCSDRLEVTATVLDTSGDPCGSVVNFSQTGTITGNFDATQTTADPATGEATVTWTAGNQCTSRCEADPNGPGICTFRFTATSGGITSSAVTVNDNIP